jgi:hypothetical protein
MGAFYHYILEKSHEHWKKEPLKLRVREARDTQNIIMCKLMINALHKNGKTLSEYLNALHSQIGKRCPATPHAF